MFEVSIISALIGGLLTFLAPCTLPLIPAYVAFIGGDQKGVPGRVRARMLLNGAYFISGFSFIFILFGLASGALGTFFVLYRTLLSQVGGVVVILFGLSMLGLLRLPRSLPQFMTTVPKVIRAGSKRGAFLLGLLFALGWSPCLGPVLGTILVLAGTTGSALHGAFLLAVYSLGLAIPFFLVAYLYGSTFSYVVTLQKYLPLVTRLGGVFLVLIGVLLVLGQFGMLNTWMLDVFGGVGYDRLVEFM